MMVLIVCVCAPFFFVDVITFFGIGSISGPKIMFSTCNYQKINLVDTSIGYFLLFFINFFKLNEKLH